MNLWQALSDRWGPFPAGMWIAAAAVGLYVFARRANQNSGTIAASNVALDAPGPGAPDPSCAGCAGITPNRALGLMGAPGLTPGIMPEVAFQGGPNPAVPQREAG